MAGAAGRLAAAFASRRARTGLIPFLTAGFPSPDLSLELMHALEAEGALALEVGIPFSDPIADGPDIQRASERALEAGTGARETLELVASYRARGTLPVVIMTYANPVLRHGLETFAREARRAGVDGVLISDLPPDEAPEAWRALDDAGLETITLVAPTTPPERLPLVLARCRGFVYCLARTGVTGTGGGYAGSLEERVAGLRRRTRLPIAVGFGISTPEQARPLAGLADAVVVGAAFTRELARDPAAGAVDRARLLARDLVAALAVTDGEP